MNRPSGIYHFILFLLIGQMLFCTAQSSVNYEETFLYANELYKKGDYQGALKHYSSIPNKSSNVHFNIGNCMFKLGKKGQALACWRRAEHDWGLFGRKELLANIALVKAQLFQEPTKKSKQPSFKNTSERMTTSIASLVHATPNFWLQLAFLLMWFFLLLYRKYLHKKGRFIIISLLFILQAFFGSLLALKYSFDLRKYGVIVQTSASIRSGPGDDYQKLGTLGEGTEVIINKQSDQFYKITHQGQIGWVSNKDLEPI
jgi:tetratricopeptide (TPR) repeat protein